MQVLASQIKGYIANSSFIRKMFEVGIELKKKYGADKVYDFSLGNPDLPPPAAVGKALRRVADRIGQPFVTGYMPNAGFPQVREKVAKYASVEQHTELAASQVILTCGAAGGLNAFFRAVLEPGDEVICPAPYFVEYGFYAGNYGGVLKPVKSKPLTFDLDLDAIDAAITAKTKVVMINSPNNPTGKIYSRSELEGLSKILARHSAGRERPIYLMADEPYRFLNYDHVEIPSVFELHPYSVVISSYSKNLSLAGERIGYVAINPKMPEAVELAGAVTLTNRILGFVNAPVLAQYIVDEVLGTEIGIDIYNERRLAMAKVLDQAGIKYTMPTGAFYFFPQTPLADDVEFCRLLTERNVLAVPGSGFGYPGYMRLAFCVDKGVIERSAPAFKQVMDGLRGR